MHVLLKFSIYIKPNINHIINPYAYTQGPEINPRQYVLFINYEFMKYNFNKINNKYYIYYITYMHGNMHIKY